ncbi:MAG: hypothetical protein WD029_07605 [Microthrixaceae bacterium]
MNPTEESGRQFWGRAWIQSLEAGSASDAGQLHRGRTDWRRNAVRELTLNPGHVFAKVVGAHGEIFTLDIAVRPLADSEWEQVADAVADKAVHLAALLDGELHAGVVDDALAVEVQLLPQISQLRPDCTCVEWAEPCRHAAAACYEVAGEIDRDPFALFLLRGITREEFISLVRSRRAAAAGTVLAQSTEEPAEGVLAAEAWLGAHLGDPLSPPPEIVHTRRMSHSSHGPGRYSPWDAQIPAQHTINTDRIDALAIDAVERAWGMIVDGQPSGLSSSPTADLARRSNMMHSSLGVAELAEFSGVSPVRLNAWAQAWIVAGDPGVAVVADTDSWSTDQQLLAEGRERLVESGFARRSIALNYHSLRMSEGLLLVIGPDNKWYRLAGSGQRQDMRLDQPPSSDIRDLVEEPS